MGGIIKLLSILTIFLISIFYFLSSGKVYADTPCQPIYGGGATCTSSKRITIEKKSMPPATTAKGGFPVLSPIPVVTSPATGPETLALFSLIPIGILGWFLRKKSRQESSL